MADRCFEYGELRGFGGQLLGWRGVGVGWGGVVKGWGLSLWRADWRGKDHRCARQAFAPGSPVATLATQQAGRLSLMGPCDVASRRDEPAGAVRAQPRRAPVGLRERRAGASQRLDRAVRIPVSLFQVVRWSKREHGQRSNRPQPAKGAPPPPHAPPASCSAAMRGCSCWRTSSQPRPQAPCCCLTWV